MMTLCTNTKNNTGHFYSVLEMNSVSSSMDKGELLGETNGFAYVSGGGGCGWRGRTERIAPYSHSPFIWLTLQRLGSLC